jgi:hypothetical protein
MLMSEKIRMILANCMQINADHQIRYSDYEKDQFTVPCKLTIERIERIIHDNSIQEIKIIIKP